MFIVEISENYQFNIDVSGGTVGHGSSVAQLPYVGATPKLGEFRLPHFVSFR